MNPNDLIMLGFVIIALTGMICIGTDMMLSREEEEY